MIDPLHWLSEALIELPATVVALCTALFTLLETSMLIGLVIPGDAVVLLAGTTVDKPSTFAMMVAAATVGGVIGETIGYAIGWRVGPRVRSSRLGRRLGEHRWARAESFLHRHSKWTLVFARFVAVAHALTPVMAGAVRVPFRRFIVWETIASFVWSVFYVSFGAAIGRAPGPIPYILLIVLVLGVPIIHLIRRRLRRNVPAEAVPVRVPS